MQCPQCSFENPSTAKFCQECGSSLALRCSNCDATLALGAKFCTSCGHPAGQASAPSPNTYAPRHLAEKILRQRTVVEGERKQVTVLFADVKESMSLAETVDPETWHRIMNEFFELLSAGVHRYEGSVNQYTGDGIMALFGAPIAHEDHAQRACYAALWLLDELARYSDQLRRVEGLNFSVRLGINSGEVVIGQINEDLRMDYTAQGHTVGLASRMEQLAAPNKCYLSANTAALVGDYFELRDLGEFRVKGVSEPLHVHELQGVGRHRTRLDVSRSRGLSRFVGREDELKRIEAALESTRNKNPRVVGIVAEPGAGKSRLCYEFVQKATRAGITVLTGHCVPHGAMIPFQPVLEVLRAYFAIEENDSPQTAREKIAGRMLLVDDAMRTHLPLVFDFLGVPDPERPVPPMDPEPRRRMLYAALRRTLRCSDAKDPAVMLIEDMHWIDGASLAFFGDMIKVLPETSEMLLMNYRPEFHPPWADDPCFEQIALEPLGPAAVGEILRDLLGNDPSTVKLATNIEKTTSGNPFFVEELVHALVEAGSLEGSRGDYRLMRPVEDIILPPTVHSVLAARIDHLPERQKEVVQSAAVIGKKFSEAVLQRIVHMDAADLRAALDALCESGFLYEREVYPAARYAFQHPLTQEVAYRTQLSDKRKGLHLTIARTLTELEPEKLDENAALLGHHWESAGELREAVSAYRRAAERASASEMRESKVHWTKVMELIDRLEPGEEIIDHAIAATEGMLSLCWRLGSANEEAHRIHDWGESWALRSSGNEARARVRAAYGAWHVFNGEIDKALGIYKEAVALLGPESDPRLRLQFASRRAYACLLAGKLRTALQLTREVIESMGEELPKAEVSLADWLFMTGFSGLVLTYLGRVPEAGRIIQRCHDLAVEAGDAGSTNIMRGFGVTHAWFTGDGVTAWQHARAQVEFAERIASPAMRAGAYDSLGVAQLLRGEWEEAVRSLETALSIARETGTFLQAEALVLANMADAYRGCGDLDRAIDVAREAVEVARTRRTLMHECRASLFLGRALLARGLGSDLVEAEHALHDALEIVHRTEARAYEPFVRAERAALAAARADDTWHRREIAHAAALFRDIGAEDRAVQIESTHAAA
ncbi:MAG TPA: adenylate/guanylate cyclase domain-containing protein [Candidatus Limnocylindrales bacterium]|nr:adenylate/guanylate cyclase domain-containing protein [Candidatus Limnocylindrales bacterium]